MREGKILKKERNVLNKLRRRIINELIDIIILNRIVSNPGLTGYAIIEYLFRRFDILVSSGIVYSTLYALEREGLIKGVWAGRKRTYAITPKGEKIVETLRKKGEIINSLVKEIITPKSSLLYQR